MLKKKKLSCIKNRSYPCVTIKTENVNSELKKNMKKHYLKYAPLIRNKGKKKIYFTL